MYSAESFKLRGDIRKNHFLGILLKCRHVPAGLDHMTISAPSKTLASSLDEYLLVVRTLLGITLDPISIPVAVGPYQK